MVVLRMISGSSRSSGITSCIKRGRRGGGGGGVIMAAFLALNRNLRINEKWSERNETTFF